MGPVPPRATIDPTVRGIDPVPSTAVGVVVNVVATASTAYGWLTVYPEGDPPLAANLVFSAGANVPGLALASVGSDGKVRVNNTGGSPSAGSVHVVIDEMGWFE